jgi:hypothetical protein
MLVLSACGPQASVPDVDGSTLTPVVSDLQATVNAQSTQIAQLTNGQSANTAASATPVARIAPPTTSTSATMGCTQGWTRPFTTPNNIDWGDQYLWTQYHVTDGINTVLVRVQPGWSIDNHATVLFDGESIQTMNVTTLDCLADEYMKNHPEAIKVWVGESPAIGWSTDIPNFWAWKAFAYTGPKIETGNAVWPSYDLPEDAKFTYCATDGVYVYGQVWDGNSHATTTDFVLVSGQITLPARLHVGTVWVVTLNGAEKSVMARFMQMTWEEHMVRDELKGLLKTYFFGPNVEAPFNFSHAEEMEDFEYSPTCN